MNHPNACGSKAGLWLGAVLALAAAAAVAAEPDPSAASDEDAELLNELMAVVEEGTAVATQTRMNVDYVPGMVTVLEGDLLESLGARTVLDALGLVPGVLTYRGRAGEPILLVRGIDFPFNSGNVKVLVNSIAVSREGSGVSSSVLHMPVEQVERLELVRGPGSVLYGDFAYMGLLNIVTRTRGASVFARPEATGNAAAGGRWFHESADRRTRFGLNASGVVQTEAEVPEPDTGSDDRHFAQLSLAHGGFSASAQSQRRKFEPTAGTPSEDQAEVLQLRQVFALTPALSSSLSALALHNEFTSRNQDFDGDLYEVAADAEWRGAQHTWVAKLSYTAEDIARTRFQPPPPPPPNPPPPPTVQTDLERRYYGIALQDHYAVLDSLTLTLGARYDRREDLDRERITPRVAAVWRVTDAHMLKAQYAEGFRSPTFFELYPPSGKSDLDLETVATSELSYIHRVPRHAARLTLFDSRHQDMIFVQAGGTFANRAEAHASGAELEFEQQLTAAFKWLTNVSYADSWSTRNLAGTREESDPAAHWLGNLAMVYRPLNSVLLSAQLSYVGERNLPAPQVDAEHRLALTASFFDVGTRGLTLRAGVRNAIGEAEHTVSVSPTGSSSVREFDDSIVSLQLVYTPR